MRRPVWYRHHHRRRRPWPPPPPGCWPRSPPPVPAKVVRSVAGQHLHAGDSRVGVCHDGRLVSVKPAAALAGGGASPGHAANQPGTHPVLEAHSVIADATGALAVNSPGSAYPRSAPALSAGLSAIPPTNLRLPRQPRPDPRRHSFFCQQAVRAFVAPADGAPRLAGTWIDGKPDSSPIVRR